MSPCPSTIAIGVWTSALGKWQGESKVDLAIVLRVCLFAWHMEGNCVLSRKVKYKVVCYRSAFPLVQSISPSTNLKWSLARGQPRSCFVHRPELIDWHHLISLPLKEKLPYWRRAWRHHTFVARGARYRECGISSETKQPCSTHSQHSIFTWHLSHAPIQITNFRKRPKLQCRKWKAFNLLYVKATLNSARLAASLLLRLVTSFLLCIALCGLESLGRVII